MDDLFVLLAVLVVVAVVVGAVVAYFALVMMIAPYVIGLTTVVLAGLFVWNYVTAMSRNLLPERFGVAGPPVDDPAARTAVDPGRDEAYEHYLFRQVWIDYRHILIEAFRADVEIVRSDYVWGVIEWLFLGHDRAGRWPQFSGWPRWFSWPFGLFVAIAVGLASAAASALFAALGLAHLALIGVAAGALGAATVVLRAGERAHLAIRGIRMTCPHPNCYEPLRLPVYECSGHGCQRRHRALLPGRQGVLRRTCACGDVLPTLLWFGRSRLVAFCPGCAQRLPDGIGTTPLRHVHLIGGPSAGKTHLVMSGVIEMMANARTALEPASDATRRDLELARSRLSAGESLDKTFAQLPAAIRVYVGEGRDRQLVYLYDPAGELLADDATADQLAYVDHAGGAIVVVDPFAIPAIAATLSRVDAGAMRAARPSPVEPLEAYERGRNAALRRLDDLGGVRAAVVVTKGDLLMRTRSDIAPADLSGPAIKAWLVRSGMGALVRSVEAHYESVQFFVTSSSTDGVADPMSPAAPMAWLLGLATTQAVAA